PDGSSFPTKSVPAQSTLPAPSAAMRPVTPKICQIFLPNPGESFAIQGSGGYLDRSHRALKSTPPKPESRILPCRSTPMLWKLMEREKPQGRKGRKGRGNPRSFPCALAPLRFSSVFQQVPEQERRPMACCSQTLSCSQ